MRGSQAQSSQRERHTSSVKGAQRFSVGNQPNLFSAQQAVQSGCMNDDAQTRDILCAAIRKCSKSREVIAEEMTYLAGRKVTVRMLNGFTAPSQEEGYRWPGDLDRAFCAVTGDDKLLTYRAELAGLHVVDANGWVLLELGREFLRQKRSATQIEMLERSLQGVDLG